MILPHFIHTGCNLTFCREISGKSEITKDFVCVCVRSQRSEICAYAQNSEPYYNTAIRHITSDLTTEQDVAKGGTGLANGCVYTSKINDWNGRGGGFGEEETNACLRSIESI